MVALALAGAAMLVMRVTVGRAARVAGVMIRVGGIEMGTGNRAMNKAGRHAYSDTGPVAPNRS
jgi:hypothetical protein